MTPLTKQAFKLAYRAHEGQVDKEGIPYILHPVMVADAMETEHEVVTALLHDVVEDSFVTVDMLREQGFPETVVEAVQKLTRPAGMEYLEYIRGLLDNPLAVKVKRADLLHNLMPEREIPEKDSLRLHKRYDAALEILKDRNM